MPPRPALLCVLLLLFGGGCLFAQHAVTGRVLSQAASQHTGQDEARGAVLWLEPVAPSATSLKWTPQASYRLLQHNKMFSPHLLVVPVGAVVTFPNGDPFFHNVFSLFNGKRFDLGLYEAGRSKDIRFERKGISYIFCNIHPEMSAVVVALTTPLWAAAQRDGTFRIDNVPAGTYEAHLWLEGEEDRSLQQWTHTVSVRDRDTVDAGTFQSGPPQKLQHADKFGRPYKNNPATY